MPPADLFALALVTKFSQTWQTCLHPAKYMVCTYEAANISLNV